MTRRIRAVLSGPDAELGRVSASDFANLLLATQSALAKTAGHILNRPVKATGRWASSIEEAAHLRLVSVGRGSVRSILEIPDVPVPTGAMDFQVATLGDMAFDALQDFVDGVGHRHMPDVAAGLVQLADQVGIGTRFNELRFEEDSRPENDRPRRISVLDPSVRERLRHQAAIQLPQDDRLVVGVLYEADFEAHRAHLRLAAGGGSVSVDFTDDLADNIQAALRQQAELVGEVTVDRQQGRAVSVRLRQITRAEQLVVGANEFWRDVSVDQLASEQGVTAAHDWDAFRGPALSEEELDEFLSFLDS